MNTILAVLLALSGSIPNVIQPRNAQVASPVWVSASTAFEKDGALRADLFTAAHQFAIEQNRLQNSSGDCQTFLAPPPSELFRPMRSIDDLATESETIITGEVIGQQTGFFIGRAGALYAVKIKDRLKTFGHADQAAVLYFFYPEATIRTARGNICARAFSDLPRPEIGDRVLLFDYTLAVDRDRMIVDPDVRKQLMIEHAGQFHVPRALGDSPRTLSDVVWRIRGSRGINNIPEGQVR